METESKIDGVIIRNLSWNVDSRGRLSELCRESWWGAIRQVYVTTARVGVVKDRDSWHMHKRQTDRFICIQGRIKLVLVDKRKYGATENQIMEIELGEKEHKAVIIPPGVLHAFKNNGDTEAIIINCIDREYNPESPDEFRIPNDFYKW